MAGPDRFPGWRQSIMISTGDLLLNGLVQPDPGHGWRREEKQGAPDRTVSDAVFLEPKRVNQNEQNRQPGQDGEDTIEGLEESLFKLHMVAFRQQTDSGAHEQEETEFCARDKTRNDQIEKLQPVHRG